MADKRESDQRAKQIELDRKNIPFMFFWKSDNVYGHEITGAEDMGNVFVRMYLTANGSIDHLEFFREEPAPLPIEKQWQPSHHGSVGGD